LEAGLRMGYNSNLVIMSDDLGKGIILEKNYE